MPPNQRPSAPCTSSTPCCAAPATRTSVMEAARGDAHTMQKVMYRVPSWFLQVWLGLAGAHSPGSASVESAAAASAGATTAAASAASSACTPACRISQTVPDRRQQDDEQGMLRTTVSAFANRADRAFANRAGRTDACTDSWGSASRYWATSGGGAVASRRRQLPPDDACCVTTPCGSLREQACGAQPTRQIC